MQRSPILGPFAAPHKTRQFWIFILLLTGVFLCEPFILRVFGMRLPLTSYRHWLGSVGITLLICLPILWLGFRFGRIVWFMVGVGLMVFAVVAARGSL